jgi:hypothetical protein
LRLASHGPTGDAELGDRVAVLDVDPRTKGHALGVTTTDALGEGG